MVRCCNWDNSNEIVQKHLFKYMTKLNKQYREETDIITNVGQYNGNFTFNLN